MFTFELRAIQIPCKPEEGEEWKEQGEDIYLPLAICTVRLNTLTEVEENELQSSILNSLKIEIGDKFLLLNPEYVHPFNLKTDKDFMAMLNGSQSLCIEIRVRNETSLVFAIGGVWDNENKTWIYEPFCKSEEFWK
jgi:hypothetical protein